MDAILRSCRTLPPNREIAQQRVATLSSDERRRERRAAESALTDEVSARLASRDQGA
jgi:hypothetical protein